MAYGQELRMIAGEATRREEAINNLAFCFDRYLEMLDEGGDHADERMRRLESAICQVTGFPDINA